MPKTRPDTVAGFSVSTPTPYRQICRLLLHLHAHFHANHLFLYHKLSNIFSIFDRFEFLSHRTHALDYCSVNWLLFTITSFFFHFSYSIKNYRDNSSFLPSPFPTIFLFSLVYSLPLTPTLTRHLRNFTHYHWNDNGRGRKRISLVGGWSRLPDSLRRQTYTGCFQIVRFSLYFRMIVSSITHRSKRASTVQVWFSGRRYDSFMVITIPSTSRWATIKQRVFRRSGPPSWSNTAVPVRKLGCDGDRGDGTRREKRREERGPCQVLEAVSCVLLG